MGRAEDDTLVNRKLDEFGIALEPELLHDAIFMKGDGAWRHTKDAGGFLH